MRSFFETWKLTHAKSMKKNPVLNRRTHPRRQKLYRTLHVEELESVSQAKAEELMCLRVGEIHLE
jgi:hypothetical protein